jgi:hypothetical protein
VLSVSLCVSCAASALTSQAQRQFAIGEWWCAQAAGIARLYAKEIAQLYLASLSPNFKFNSFDNVNLDYSGVITMSFQCYHRCQQVRAYVLPPFLDHSRCFHGDITLDDYSRVFKEAVTIVKHTTPLMPLAHCCLNQKNGETPLNIVDEESLVRKWILNDINNCGYDKTQARPASRVLPRN